MSVSRDRGSVLATFVAEVQPGSRDGTLSEIIETVEHGVGTVSLIFFGVLGVADLLFGGLTHEASPLQAGET